MHLDCHPPIAGGREIWGFPKKLGHPKLEIKHDTLTGLLEYAGVTVAIATMAYKHENLICPDSGRPLSCDADGIAQKMQKTQVNLKIIPDIDGSLKIVQLVAYNLEHINIKGAWEGPARLALFPHVNAPVADLPVKKVLFGTHFVADLNLPYGRVLYDYKEAE
jgi:acetoacetate decarboxylase